MPIPPLLDQSVPQYSDSKPQDQHQGEVESFSATAKTRGFGFRNLAYSMVEKASLTQAVIGVSQPGGAPMSDSSAALVSAGA